MNTFKWLLKREYWEHKGAFFWAPLVVGALMTAFITVSMVIALSGAGEGLQINGVKVAKLAAAMTPEQISAFATKFIFSYAGITMPIFVVLAICIFFFCLGALFDERRDRSVLFWKSLPLSDSAAVLSKVVFAIGVAPVMAFVIATITSLVIVMVVCMAAAVAGVNIFGAVLTNPATYVAPIQIAAILPIYAMWALPTIGWLLMVSAWARTKPLLWAVAVPVMAGILLSWAEKLLSIGVDVSWFWKNIIGRLLGSVFPGGWLSPDNRMPDSDAGSGALTAFSEVLQQSWQLLGGANIWLGAAAGAAMIYVAIRLRGWRDEG